VDISGNLIVTDRVIRDAAGCGNAGVQLHQLRSIASIPLTNVTAAGCLYLGLYDTYLPASSHVATGNWWRGFRIRILGTDPAVHWAAVHQY